MRKWILILFLLASPGLPQETELVRGTLTQVYYTEEPAAIGKIHSYLLEVESDNGTRYLHLERLEKTLQAQIDGPEVPPKSGRGLDFQVVKDHKGRLIVRSWAPTKY